MTDKYLAYNYNQIVPRPRSLNHILRQIQFPFLAYYLLHHLYLHVYGYCTRTVPVSGIYPSPGLEVRGADFAAGFRMGSSIRIQNSLHYDVISDFRIIMNRGR